MYEYYWPAFEAAHRQQHRTIFNWRTFRRQCACGGKGLPCATLTEVIADIRRRGVPSTETIRWD
jgi:hypothetical protein